MDRDRPLVFAAVALLAALSFRCCEGVARADTLVLPAGTEVRTPDGQTRTLGETRFAVERADLDAARGAMRREPELEAALAGCAADLERARQPDAVSAWRWAALGALVALSFAGGVWVGAGL